MSICGFLFSDSHCGIPAPDVDGCMRRDTKSALHPFAKVQSEAELTEASHIRRAALFRFDSLQCVVRDTCVISHGSNGWDLSETNGMGGEVIGGFDFSPQGLHR